MIFQTSKVLQCQFFFKCAGHCVDRGAFLRLRADKTKEKQRLSARCAPVGCRTRAPTSKHLGRKFWIDFSPISDESTVTQVDRGRFLNLQVSEIKRKANEAQNEGGIYQTPQYGRQSVCTLFVDV
jgi:hypothetical protein